MMNLVSNQARSPRANLILAHGAGAGSDTPFMTQIAQAVSEQGINVYRFDFPYMQVMQETGKRRPPDKMPRLLESFVQVIEQVGQALPLFIGGKSMGGRVASMLVDEQPVAGAVCLGYPFHPPGKPEKLRIEHLQQLNKPILIVQGERDTFGRREEAERYELSNKVELAFLTDGDHSFKPRKASGVSEQHNLHEAAGKVAEFILSTNPEEPA